jgi:SAM-dependent methyltransferase
MIKKLAKATIHTISGNRKFYYRELEKVAVKSNNKIVLELGSGIKVKGKEAYSAKHIFSKCKEFIQTDVNKEFGHKYLDVTKMKDKEAYDVILCLNVLEHVYDFQKAVDNMHRALKPKGKVCIGVPFTFPLHDEPGDYWRFTEHSLRKILNNYSKVEVKPQRSRVFPTGYFVLAQK